MLLYNLLCTDGSSIRDVPCRPTFTRFLYAQHAQHGQQRFTDFYVHALSPCRITRSAGVDLPLFPLSNKYPHEQAMSNQSSLCRIASLAIGCLPPLVPMKLSYGHPSLPITHSQFSLPPQSLSPVRWPLQTSYVPGCDRRSLASHWRLNNRRLLRPLDSQGRHEAGAAGTAAAMEGGAVHGRGEERARFSWRQRGALQYRASRCSGRARWV